MDDVNIDNKPWAESPEVFGREERLIAYVNVISGKTGVSREIPTSIGYAFIRWKNYINQYYSEHEMNRRVEPNDLVFGNINYNGKSYYHQSYGEAWRQVRSNIEGKLVGHKFIKKNYSLYSLRLTFIENKLLGRYRSIFIIAYLWT